MTKGNGEILTKIKNEIAYYRDIRPDSFPSMVSDQRSLFSIIDLYYISKFRDGDRDNLGQKKTFYNITSLPVDVSDKELDIDTKNIKIIPEDWFYEYGCLALQMELTQWMKLKYFGRELNKYSYLLSKYGTLVVKKVANEVRTVPIQNLIFRPDAYSFNDTPLVEVHHYNSEDDFKAEAEVLSWENYDMALENYRNDNKKGPKFLVYEAYFPPKMLKGSNYFLISQYGDVLSYDRKENNIYKGTTFEDLPGRLAGRGQAERVLEEQVYLNRIANYKAEGAHWASKQLLWSRDGDINENLLSGYNNGDILVSANKPDRIDTRELNLNTYSYEEQRYEGNAYRRTFSSNPMTGEGSQPGVPFRSSFMSSQQAGGFYKKKRENLASFVKEILTDWVIPEFKKENRKEHEIMIESVLSDDEKSDAFLENLVNIKISEKMKSYGQMTPRELEVSRAIIRDRLLKDKLIIPSSYYDKIKYNVKIDITGESIDNPGLVQAKQMMATITAQNPGIWENPMTARLFRKLFTSMGMSGLDMPVVRKNLDDVLGRDRAQVGGSVARPTQNLMPMQQAEQLTV